MKKKGFTLLELLGVIVLLGILALISLPAVKDYIDNSKEKLLNEQLEYLETSLKSWANANVFSLPEQGDAIKLTLGQLKQSGYVDMKVANPKNNKCLSNEMLFTITSKNNSYIYEVGDVIDVECSSVEDAPTIDIDNEVVRYLEVGEEYTATEVTAKDSSNSDITSSMTTNITGTSTSISTTSAGKYVITYKVTKDGKTMAAIQNVFVK